MNPPSPLKLHWRPFRLPLSRPLLTAAGTLSEKRGWLLRLEGSDSEATGASAQGWGEAAPLPSDPAHQAEALRQLSLAIAALGRSLPRDELEQRLPGLPPPLGFALGSALAELDGQVGEAAGGWLAAPAAAVLLPAGKTAVTALEQALMTRDAPGEQKPQSGIPFTCKWKVAAEDDALERQVLEALLEWLPPGSRLRLDANGGWDRPTAAAWAARLAGDSRLEWLEQPLATADRQGLEAMAAGPPAVPVALDESLREDPSLRESWSGWQVRRPSQEGDPRPLLTQLENRLPRRMLSTGFETGIGRRWLEHMAALQTLGPTPTAPGLAPGWSTAGPLASSDPEQVWEAAPASVQTF